MPGPDKEKPGSFNRIHAVGLSKGDLFDLILSNFPVGLVLLDDSERVLEFNPAAEKITGLKKDQVIGRLCHEVLKGLPCDVKELCHYSDQAIAADFLHFEGVILHRDGHQVPVVYTGAPLFQAGRLMGGVFIFRDITKEKELEKHRQVVISMFAHDLKGPLALAGAFLKRLLDEKAGPLNQKQRTYLETACRELLKVEKYVYSFLDILRMEAGDIPLCKEPCDIAELINDVLFEFRARADEKNIHIEAELPDSLPKIRLDKGQLQRVLMNLLDNAIKFSPENSTVVIRVEDRKDCILFQVVDEGPGICEDDLPHIFDPFYRAHQEEKVEGSGIGLAIVKSIVEAHGGRVWINNRRDGHTGAIFSFTIPFH